MSKEKAWPFLRTLASGDTCIVIGNGPSLKDVPDSFLSRYDTFGTNRIYLRKGFCPSFYVAVNPLVIQQSTANIRSMESYAKFIANDYAGSIPGAYPLHSAALPYFSFNPWKQIYEGYTVTFVCLQLAYYLGYKRVLLVGVDHKYQYKGMPNQEVVSEGSDPNHFDPSYFGKGVAWNLPDLENSEKAYWLAKHAFAADGREIINLTTDTALSVFDRQPLGDYL